ncbi:Imm74 family immunity protein [Methylocapsa acidiphila]|uniref:Imm74 family immunity protein n=1 Tax=Methylocapsa acidiphila TaxID=133552 RepID=UPI00047908BF|nr:Imm74 family immunity protein [Methylocapsa acidiphila]
MPARRRSGPQVTLTEGSIRILWREKVLTIVNAPDLSDGEEPADFVVDLDAIVSWDAPHDANAIEVEDLQEIMQAIEAECERRGLVVAFE